MTARDGCTCLAPKCANCTRQAEAPSWPCTVLSTDAQGGKRHFPLARPLTGIPDRPPKNDVTNLRGPRIGAVLRSGPWGFGFAWTRSPFLRKQVKPFDDPVDPSIVGIPPGEVASSRPCASSRPPSSASRVPSDPGAGDQHVGTGSASASHRRLDQRKRPAV